jgi:acetate kinase
LGMAFTLVINPGSSSKKFALFDGSILKLEAYVERSDEGYLMCSTVGGVQQTCGLLDKKGYKHSLGNFIENAKSAAYINSNKDITRVAIRVVAPGTFFAAHKVITDSYIAKLRQAEILAPLHIPHILEEISAVKEYLKDAELIGVSDSAFHSTLLAPAKNYSLSKEIAEKHDLYRFGYHGLSVSSVVSKLDRIYGKAPSRLVVCHIGSGVSVTTVKDGKSIDTTMGFAPGSGLVMGSRAGDVDAGALLALMQLLHLKVQDAQMFLQTEGGLRAMAGDSDLRLLLEKRSKGDEGSVLAMESFVFHIKKAIGAAAAVLDGLDEVVLTATASERSPILRTMIAGSLSGLGVLIDEAKNYELVGREGVISAEDSSVVVRVVKTNEAKELFEASLTI